MSNEYMHVAMFMFPDEDGRHEVESALDRLRGVVSLIDGIIDVRWAVANRSFGDYTHIIVVNADGPDSLQKYREHQIRIETNNVFKKWDRGHCSADFFI